MAEQNINSQALRDGADKMRQYNNTLFDILNNFQNKINSLTNVWVGDAQSELVQQFTNKLYPRFQEYYDVINSYADYLITTAESYEAAEETLISQADTTTDFA
ncbi:MAG: WXG100 family type VII secretion target [Acutalibacteraceae bacterium]